MVKLHAVVAAVCEVGPRYSPPAGAMAGGQEGSLKTACSSKFQEANGLGRQEAGETGLVCAWPMRGVPEREKACACMLVRTGSTYEGYIRAEADCQNPTDQAQPPRT